MARLFLVNQTPATPAVAIYQLKELLKTAGWTVPKSSDGSTYNSSGDEITSGASGAGGMDNAKAWFVIQMPGCSRSFCLQRTSVIGVNESRYWRIKYSKVAGFVGGTPGILQVPSATDEKVLLSTGTDASPTFNQLLFYDGDGLLRFNAFADNVAPYGFLSWSWRHTAGLTSHAFGLDPLQATAAGDADPYAIIIQPAPAADSAWKQAALYYNGYGISFWCGPVFYRGAGSSPAAQAVTFMGGASGDIWLLCADNVHTGEDEALPLAAFAFISTVGPNFHYKGILTLTKAVAQAGRHTGDLGKLDGVEKSGVCVGNCWLPWDESSIPLV